MVNNVIKYIQLLCLIRLILVGGKRIMGFMKTRWTDLVDRNNPLPEYPRPQMERDNWMTADDAKKFGLIDSVLERK